MLHFDALTPAYVPVMAALHALSFDRGWSEKEFFDLLKLPTNMGFISQEGFILCSVVEDEAEIITLCVAPKARRKGVASALLKKTEENLKSELGMKQLFRCIIKLVLSKKGAEKDITYMPVHIMMLF